MYLNPQINLCQRWDEMKPYLLELFIFIFNLNIFLSFCFLLFSIFLFFFYFLFFHLKFCLWFWCLIWSCFCCVIFSMSLILLKLFSICYFDVFGVDVMPFWYILYEFLPFICFFEWNACLNIKYLPWWWCSSQNPMNN